MRILTGIQDTRENHEDFALTPFIFLVYVNKTFKVFGLGLSWGFYAIYIGLGFNIPKNYKRINKIQ